ncbi:MAG: hypothetical protein M5U09_21650 [Gammaproteobacteria bacterium]|nr:hypothetical protein [Gammaproteobacteria bacterium]
MSGTATANGEQPAPAGVYTRLLRHAWPYRWVFLAGVLGMFIGGAAEAGFAALLSRSWTRASSTAMPTSFA